MNASTHRLVTLIVGAALLLCIVGIIVLAALEKDAPKVLELVTSSALTGLIGLIASPKAESVTIDQPADDPIPVRDAGAFDSSLVVTVLLVIVLALAALWLGTQLFEFRG